MHESLGSEFLGLDGNSVSHSELVGLDDEMGTCGDIRGVLLRCGIYDKYVFSRFKEFVHRGISSRYCLVDNERFDLRIIGKLSYYAYHLLLLGHEVVRPRYVHDAVAILFYHFLCRAVFFFVLGNSVRNDRDLALFRRCFSYGSKRCEGKETERQNNCRGNDKTVLQCISLL